jgi:tRNA threonylcarbamoyladenosine biosynthesis protein TsaE
MMYFTNSEADTFAFGRALGACLRAGDCVLLTGDLGAGKSVLVRGVADAHGVTGAMPSPTFVLMIPYEGDVKIYHFDLYRLGDPDEFYEAGLEEFVGGDGIALIEWPQMADLHPAGAVHVELRRGAGDDDRVICVTGLTDEKLDAWRAEE